MQNRPSATLRRFVSTLAALATVAAPYAAFVPMAHADTTLLSESFGVGSSSADIPDWEEEGGDADGGVDVPLDGQIGTFAKAATSGNNSASPSGGRFAMIGNDEPFGSDGEWICRKVDATGYEALVLGYHWRGDIDAEPHDEGRVEYATDGADCDSATGWVELREHELNDGSEGDSWALEEVILSESLADTSFFLRFRNDAAWVFGTGRTTSEQFRVDGVTVVGEEIPTTGTIIVRKVLAGMDEDDFTQFSFSVNEGDDIAFEEDGENELTEQELGEYSIEEGDGPSGYTTTYDNCEFELEAGATEICTITNTEVPPAHIIVKKRVQGNPHEGDAFDFQLREFFGEGSAFLASRSIEAPALADSFFDVFFDTEEDSTNVIVRETGMTAPWQFEEVLCWAGNGPRPSETPEPTMIPEPSPSDMPDYDDYQAPPNDDDEELPLDVHYDGESAFFGVSPGDVVTCEFTNRRPGGGSNPEFGTLVLEKYIRGGSTSFDAFSFDVDGAMFGASGFFDESGRDTFDHIAAGPYAVSEDVPDGYTASFGGDCSETGSITVPVNGTATCEITNTADGWEEGDGEVGPNPDPGDDDNVGGGPLLGFLVVEKVIVSDGLASDSFEDFSFVVGSESHQFETDGDTELPLASGSYTVLENEALGYTTTYGGDCDENGVVTVTAGATSRCVVTNTLAVGGFNPEATPTPSPTPAGSGGTGRSLGSAAGATPSPSPAVTASASPLTASIGGDGWEVCVLGGGWLKALTIIVFALAGLLLLLVAGLRGGRAFALLLVLALVLYWLGSGCADALEWLPFVLGGVVWILLGRAPDAA
jgi:hypothetical protein